MEPIILNIVNDGNEYDTTTLCVTPRFTVDGIDVKVVYNQRPCVNNNELVSVADYHIYCLLDNDAHEYERELLGHKAFFQRRLPKSIQLARLYQVTRWLKEIEVQLPLFSSDKFDRSNMHPAAVAAGCSSGKVVIKENNGANGEGQILLPVDRLFAFLQHIDGGDCPVEGFDEIFPDAIVIPRNKDTIIGEDWIATPYIDDVVAEYRFLIFGNVLMGYERTRSEDPYPQVKSVKRNKKDVRDLTLLPLDQLVDKEISRHIKSICAALNLYMGSIDLYRRADGTFGIFEYSTQYGYFGISNAQISELSQKAVGFVLRTLGAQAPTVARDNKTNADEPKGMQKPLHGRVDDAVQQIAENTGVSTEKTPRVQSRN